jgi:small basic protein
VIAALALVVGLVLGLVLEPSVPAPLQPYLPIAVVAALDAVFGGIRARLDGIFDDKVFVVSFVSNVLIAALIVFLGDKLGVGGQLSRGVVVVLFHA